MSADLSKVIAAMEAKAARGADIGLEVDLIDLAYKRALKNRHKFWTGGICRSFTDLALAELQDMSDRIVSLLEKADAETAAGQPCSAVLDEVERLIPEFESKVERLAHGGKLVIFEPRHGPYQV